MKALDGISWGFVIIFCLTLGLAPFVPEPHIWQKLIMLVNGELHRPIDIFDLLFHAIPWLLLIAKDDDGRIVTRQVAPVRFVPLTGER